MGDQFTVDWKRLEEIPPVLKDLRWDVIDARPLTDTQDGQRACGSQPLAAALAALDDALDTFISRAAEELNEDVGRMQRTRDRYRSSDAPWWWFIPTPWGAPFPFVAPVEWERHDPDAIGFGVDAMVVDGASVRVTPTTPRRDLESAR